MEVSRFPILALPIVPPPAGAAALPDVIAAPGEAH